MEKTIIPKYRTPVFSVAAQSTKPKIAIDLATVICQVRSLNFPELYEYAIDKNPAIKYGGQVKTNVIVRLNPNVLTAVGKKFLNPLAAKCMCCMKANSHNLGSEAAVFKPFHTETLSFLAPTWSPCTRLLARRRSSGVSQRVTRGSSGRMKAAPRATRPVAAPWMMKSHCHAARFAYLGES